MALPASEPSFGPLPAPASLSAGRLQGTFENVLDLLQLLIWQLSAFPVPSKPAMSFKDTVLRGPKTKKKCLDHRFSTETKASMGLFRHRKPVMSFPMKDYVRVPGWS